MENMLLKFIIIIAALVIAYKCVPYIYRYIQKKKMQRIYRKAKIHQVGKMKGIEFEYYLEALFSKLKYKPTVTKATHDFGADLKSDNRKVVVQAKRSNSKIGIRAI